MTTAPPLAEAADQYFLSSADFLGAFRADPHAAIVALRDDPLAFGAVRNYLGKLYAERKRKAVLTAARRVYATMATSSQVAATYDR